VEWLLVGVVSKKVFLAYQTPVFGYKTIFFLFRLQEFLLTLRHYATFGVPNIFSFNFMGILSGILELFYGDVRRGVNWRSLATFRWKPAKHIRIQQNKLRKH
jgi:hypothetical protein